MRKRRLQKTHERRSGFRLNCSYHILDLFIKPPSEFQQVVGIRRHPQSTQKLNTKGSPKNSEGPSVNVKEGSIAVMGPDSPCFYLARG